MTENPHDNEVLITGGSGKLGRLLRAASRRDGVGNIRVVFQSRSTGTDLTWTPGDPLSALPRCGTVVALWGVTSGSKKDLAANQSLVGTSVDVARACKAQRLIHVSTAAIYGPGQALAENTPPHPAGAYGEAKLKMERAVARLPKSDALRHCCLRVANIVGAESLGRALRGGGTIRLDRFPNGAGPLRSYLAASDLLKVLCGLSSLPPEELPPVLNVAPPHPVTMEALARAAGREIEWVSAPETAVQEVTLDASLLQGLLPAIPFLSAPEDLIADWLELENGI